MGEGTIDAAVVVGAVCWLCRVCCAASMDSDAGLALLSSTWVFTRAAAEPATSTPATEIIIATRVLMDHTLRVRLPRDRRRISKICPRRFAGHGRVVTLCG